MNSDANMLTCDYTLQPQVLIVSVAPLRKEGMTVPKGDFWRVNRGGNFYRNVCDESLYTKYPTYLYHPGGLLPAA